MPAVDIKALERAIAELPLRYPGPGGAVAVVKDGEAIIRHAWGFSDLERGIAYTPATMAPICSITKQFTCATMLDVVPNPDDLRAAIASRLPHLAGERPSPVDLANNQSGLRDYWALTVLTGAMPEGEFLPQDSAALLALTKSLHFAPGTRYSYSNGNFRLLADAVEEKTGRSFGDLVEARTIKPAGMETAVFVTDTGALPGGAIGYEGTLATGWRPGVNRIHWKGDAGICASLDDIIAWEQFIDRTRDDADGLYRRISTPVSFRDGTPASYGFGLQRRMASGRQTTGHGGAIRGWRLHRIHSPADRLSVMIAFNHESDAMGAALSVLAAAIGDNSASPVSNAALAEGFAGCWLDGETTLLLDVSVRPDGRLAATFGGVPRVLDVGEDGIARGVDTLLRPEGDGIRIMRAGDNLSSVARAVEPVASVEMIEGVWRSLETESEIEIVNAGGSCFARFRGLLGVGPYMPMTQAGKDLWRIACHRALDAPAPGDWTVAIRRSPDGSVAGMTVGCLIARDVTFS